jgi:hypothetical protein
MTASREKSVPKPDPIPAIVDELGDLDKELSPFAAKIARVEALRKALRAEYLFQAADKNFLAEGARYVVAVGERGMERSVDIPALVKAIGAKVFAGIASISLKALEANVAPNVALDVVTSARTGFRTLKVMEKAQTEKAKK